MIAAAVNKMSKREEKKARRKTAKLLTLYFQGKLQSKKKIKERRSKSKHRPGSSWGSGVGGVTNAISNPVEETTAESDYSRDVVEFLKEIIEDLEDALDTVSDREYKILRITYSRNDKTDNDIAAKINSSVNKVRKDRRELLNELARFLNVDYYFAAGVQDSYRTYTGIVQLFPNIFEK